MVKKVVKNAGNDKSSSAGGAAGMLDSQLAGAVKESAQQIWLAGMGAFAKAQAEGGKVFEALVKEGMSLQKKTQGMAEDKISEVTGRMSAMADTVTSKAGQNWDKLEAIFEQRTAKALGKLGVPTAKDVQGLTARVDALAAAVARLGGGAKAKAPVAGKQVAAKKPAAKKATAKAAAKTAGQTSAPAKRSRAARKTA